MIDRLIFEMQQSIIFSTASTTSRSATIFSRVFFSKAVQTQVVLPHGLESLTRIKILKIFAFGQAVRSRTATINAVGR